eukprot:1188754-Prorocentrum_minimum.AAC.2
MESICRCEVIITHLRREGPLALHRSGQHVRARQQRQGNIPWNIPRVLGEKLAEGVVLGGGAAVLREGSVVVVARHKGGVFPPQPVRPGREACAGSTRGGFSVVLGGFSVVRVDLRATGVDSRVPGVDSAIHGRRGWIHKRQGTEVGPAVEHVDVEVGPRLQHLSDRLDHAGRPHSGVRAAPVVEPPPPQLHHQKRRGGVGPLRPLMA